MKFLLILAILSVPAFAQGFPRETPQSSMIFETYQPMYIGVVPCAQLFNGSSIYLYEHLYSFSGGNQGGNNGWGNQGNQRGGNQGWGGQGGWSGGGNNRAW